MGPISPEKIRGLIERPSVKNGMWMYLLQLFNTVIPLLTLPYVTRILGRDGYGLFSIALNFVGYLQVVVEYGFGMSATRKVAVRAGDDHDLLERTFSCVLFARVALTVACFAVTAVYCLFNTSLVVQCTCLAVMFSSILGYCVQQNWLFQGMQDMKFISIVNIVGRTVSTVLIFLLVKRADDLYLYCLLYSVSPIISGFAGLIVAKRAYALKVIRVGVGDVLAELKDGFFVFTTQLSSKVFGAIGVTILGVFCVPEVVGSFAAIQKIPTMMMMLWAPVSQVLYPIASRRLSQSFSAGYAFVMRVRRYALLTFGAACLVIALFSHFIVTLAFGPEYGRDFYWTIPLLGWLLAGINNNFFGIQVLLGSGHDKEYSTCFQIGVAATLVLNLVLIWLFGGDGAAWAPLASELVLTALLYRQVGRLRRESQEGEDAA